MNYVTWFPQKVFGWNEMSCQVVHKLPSSLCLVWSEYRTSVSLLSRMCQVTTEQTLPWRQPITHNLNISHLNPLLRTYKTNIINALPVFRISLTLSCPMDLKLYPLDRQQCELRIASCKLRHIHASFILTFSLYLIRWLDNSRSHLYLERNWSCPNCKGSQSAKVQIGTISNHILQYNYKYRWCPTFLSFNYFPLHACSNSPL